MSALLLASGGLEAARHPAGEPAPDLVPSEARIQGQASTPSPEDIPIMPHRVTQIGIEDGLTASTVYDFAEALDGRIWVATSDGISIFDGESVETLYRAPDGRNGLRSDHVVDLTFDGQGNLWISTMGGGLTRYDPVSGTGRAWFGGHSLADDVHVTVRGAEGRIWIGSDAGLAYHAPGLDAPVRVVPRLRSPVRAILPLASGALLVGTIGEGLLRVDPVAETVAPITMSGAQITPHMVSALMLDSRGEVWVGFEDGGLWYGTPDAAFFTRAPFVGARDIPALAEDESGRHWIATWSEGIFVHDPETGRTVNHRAFVGDPRSLPSDTVTALRIGPGGTAWIGTNDAGMAYGTAIENAVISYVSDPDGRRGPPSPMVLSLAAADEGGRLWVGTAAGLSLLDPDTARFRDIPVPGGSAGGRTDVRAILAVGEDLLLGIRRRGLVRLSDPMGPAPRLSARLLQDDFVHAIHRAADGGYWIGTHRGLVRLDAELRVLARHLPGRDDGTLPHQRIRAIYDDPSGRLWIGSSGGLSLYRPDTDDFVSWTREEGWLRDNDVRAIHVAAGRPDLIWAATGGGLTRLDLMRGIARHLGRAEGLPSESLYAIHRDRLGRLWLPSANGLARLDPDETIDAAAGGGGRAAAPDQGIGGTVTLFGPRNGLQGAEFNFNAVAALPRQKLALGGVSGLSIFDPIRLGLRTRPPILTTRVTLPEPGAIPRLTLTATVVEFTDPPRNRLDARLVPLETQWRSSSGVAHELAWDRLAPGDYELQVRYAGADGSAGPVITAAGFAVPMPFWQGMTGRLLMAVIVAGAIWGLIRGRLHYSERRARALEETIAHKTAELTRSSEQLRSSNSALTRELEHRRRFYLRMSHELRAPLAMIAAPMAEWSRRGRIDRRLQEVMLRASDRLGALVREMASVADSLPLEPRRVTIDLDRLVLPVLELYNDRAMAGGCTVTARMPAMLGSATIDSEALETILNALLSDAIERGPAGTPIGFEMSLSTDLLQLRVTTQGPGPTPDALRSAQGFSEGKAAQLPRGPLEVAGAAVFDCGGRMTLSSGEQSEGGGGLAVVVGLPCHTLAPSGPLQELDLAAAVPAEAPGAAPAPPLQGGGEILVLEDDGDLNDYICEVLAELGPVRGVRSLAAARRALNRHPIGLLVSDVILPDGNGFDLIAEIRDAPEFAQLAVVVLTGHDDRLTRGRASDLATEQFLSKPFKPEDLLTRCRRSLRVIAQMHERLVASQPPSEGPAQAPRLPAPFDSRMEAAFETYLAEEFGNKDVSLAGAAQACGLSVRSLQRFLARDGGAPFRDRLQTRRMDHAMHMLRGGAEVEETARACGFAGTASFSRSFRAVRGMTPSEARSGRGEQSAPSGAP